MKNVRDVGVYFRIIKYGSWELTDRGYASILLVKKQRIIKTANNILQKHEYVASEHDK